MLELLDIAGRRLAKLDVGTLGAGAHMVDITPLGHRLAPGLYWLLLTQREKTVTAKAAVVR